MQNMKRLLVLRTDKTMTGDVWPVDNLTAVRAGMAVVATDWLCIG